MNDNHLAQAEMMAELERHRAAVHDNPASAEARTDFGLAAARLELFDEAIAAFEDAIALDPGIPAAHINLGTIFAYHGRYEEARQSFERALALDEGYPETYTNLGHVLQELGELDAAKVSCLRALELDEYNSGAAFILHGLLYDEHNPAPAVEALDIAVTADPSDEQSVLFHGILLEQMGESDAALQCFARLTRDPSGYHPGLDAWEYVKSKRGPETRLFAPTVQTLEHAMKQATLSGLVLEFGVNYGATLRLIAAAAGQQVHGFDSFEGLPENWHDQSTGAYSTHGERPRVPDNAELHAGWFEDTLPEFLSTHTEPIRFLHVDCDLYSSTVTIFKNLGSHIVPGSVIVFDEYLMNGAWREDEFKAFQEAVDEYGWQYEYIAFSLFAKQAAVRILSVSSRLKGY